MSGICGVCHWNMTPVEPASLQDMARAAAYRGPDGISFWLGEGVGLAHLALHVTPEQQRERLPLVVEHAGLALVADARIDNRAELIAILGLKRHLAARHPTDAELILAAYQRWGTACAAHLLGDFAFAIWDARERRLFAARDAMNMRALYYRTESQRLLFATDGAQILALPEVPVRIFEPAVGAHLLGRFDRLDWTFYEGIAQLPPAHALVANTMGVRTWRYWEVDPEARIEYTDERQYVEHFVDLFSEAVRCRLRSAYPAGVLLSGGLDSGSVASMGGWLRQQPGGGDLAPLRAYCFAFESLPECDERSISDGIVHHYDLPMTAISAETAWLLWNYPAHTPTGGSAAIEIIPITTQHAFMQLARNSFAAHVATAIDTTGHRLRRLARLAQHVPVRRLRYPSGVQYLPNVQRAIRDDLCTTLGMVA